MEFCADCGNILLPKKQTNELFCRVCKTSIPIKGKEKVKLDHYKKAAATKKSKKAEKQRALRTAVIVEQDKRNKSMTEDEREAYGELLEMSGD